MTPPGNLSSALELERNRFMKFISEARTEEQTEVAALEHNLAARGLALSGSRFSGEMKIFLKKINGIIDKRIMLRREVGAKVPALLENQSMITLKAELDQFVDSATGGFITRLSSRQGATLAGAIREALRGEIQRQAAGIKARLNNELRALPLESQLGLHREAVPVTSIHISNSTIATLNLGTVVGDLNSSIQNLTNQGHADMATAIQRLAEAIAASQELQDAQRRDLLEHLSLVGTEAEHPAESRRAGLLKSSISFLQTGLNITGQLATLWSAAEHALKALGVTVP